VARDGSAVEEEGCLSLPGVKCKMKRFARVTVRGQDLAGEPVELTGEGLSARIFQHEVDHLEGTLLVDRMTAVGRLANRRVLKDLQEQHEGGGG
jgi:peptide deformylase